MADPASPDPVFEHRTTAFKAVVTLLVAVAYLGPLAYSFSEGKLDIASYIAGVGPSFGVVLSFWFKSSQ